MSKNIANAEKALSAELEAGHQSHEDLEGYLHELDAVIERARAVKALYKKEVAVLASKKSRAARKARIDRALKLLAEQEAASESPA